MNKFCIIYIIYNMEQIKNNTNYALSEKKELREYLNKLNEQKEEI